MKVGLFPKIAIIGIIAVAGTLIILSLLPKGFEYYSIGDAFQLSVAPNYLINCSGNNQLYIRYIGDINKYAVTSTYQQFYPQITYQLVSPSTKKLVDNFVNEIELTCDVPDPTKFPTTVEGNLIVSVTAYNSKGQQIIIVSPSIITVTQRIVPDNIKIKLPAFQIEQEDIDSKLDTGTGSYPSQIRLFIVPNLTFKIGGGVNSISTYKDSNYITAFTALVQKQPTAPSAPLGTTLIINAYSPKVFQQPLTYTQRFLAVEVQADNWVADEGRPILIVSDPTKRPIMYVTPATTSNNDKDKYTEFQYYLQVPEIVGTWTLEVKGSGLDNPRQHSVRTFEILAPSTIPKPITQTNPPSTTSPLQPEPCQGLSGQALLDCKAKPPSTTPIPTPTLPIGTIGQLQFLYQANFANDIQTGRIPENIASSLFTAEIKPLDIISASKTLSGKLFYTKVETILQLTAPYNNYQVVKPISITHTGYLTINNKDIRMSQYDLLPLLVNTRDSGGFVHLTAFEITGQKIQQLLEQNAIIATKEGTRLDLAVDVTGSFTLIDYTGKQIPSIIKNARFIQQLLYIDITSSVGDQEPCQGLSGQPLIDCKQKISSTPPPSSTGGYCEGLTSQQCLDKSNSGGNIVTNTPNPINDFTCLITNTCDQTPKTETPKPTGTGGAVGLCQPEQSLSECFDSIPDAVSTEVSGIDKGILLLILIFVIIIIVIIVIYKLVKRR